jgi:RNA polymerase sigma factor for flagellar operon FliA
MVSPTRHFSPVDPEDPESLLDRYGEVIYYHANRLTPRLPDGLERGDLLNAGMLALIQAAKSYDPSRGVQFRTFADYRVRGAMVDEMRRADWMGTETRRRAHQVEDALVNLEQDLGRPPQAEEVAGYLNMDLKAYQRLLGEVRGMALVSLEDLEMGEDDLPSGEVAQWLYHGRQSEAFSELELDEMVEGLARGVEALPERERLVLALYYHEELSMKEVGEVLEVSESRVSQLHTQAVLRLRGRLGLDADVGG